jgi:hypothetical protein
MQLSKVLFWDTNYDKIDWQNSARYVIGRVLMYGKMSDWEAIKAFYGLERIKKEMLVERDLDAKTLAFLSNLFQIQPQSFQCYITKQSIPKHWDY